MCLAKKRYHLNGFVPEDPEYIRQTEPETYQAYLTGYQDLAKELEICLVPGTIAERHPFPSSTQAQDQSLERKVLYNTTYFISSTGAILSTYRKNNLWHPERPYLTSSGVTGDPHSVFDTPIGKVGLLICWDLAFSEAFRELVRAGAEIIVVPTFCECLFTSLPLFSIWTNAMMAGTKHDATPAVRSHNPNSERLFLESTLAARTFENTCGVVFANAAGGSSDPDDKFLGLSRVVLPVIGTVGSMENEEGVLVVDMDLGLLDVAEECYKVRKDLTSAGWHYGYRR